MTEPTALEAFRDRTYRLVFVAAGIYNLAFGAWAGLFPRSFFRVFALEPPRYPSLWACLGMVVGVYGLLYLHAARRLDQAAPIIAVGLLGKLLGPIGLIVGSARGGDLPLRMLPLLALNDLVWWVPFGLFLVEGRRAGPTVRALAPYLCAALHAAAALVMLLVLRGGTEAEPLLERRILFLREHALAWQLGLAVWMAAGMSILGFYAWWAPGARSAAAARTALLIAAMGLAADLVGEALYLAWLPWLAEEAGRGVAGAVTRFAEIQRAGTLLTGLVANGLYTVAGVILTRTTRLPATLAAVAWLVWVAGAVMSASAALGSARGLIASSALLFPALIALALGMAWRTR